MDILTKLYAASDLPGNNKSRKKRNAEEIYNAPDEWPTKKQHRSTLRMTPARRQKVDPVNPEMGYDLKAPHPPLKGD